MAGRGTVNDHIGAVVLVVLAAILLIAGVVTHLRVERTRAKAQAMLRHPSARPTMTAREHDYHSSNQFGR